MKIEDKRIVVTGAASGIGLALCEEFHASGVKSIVCVDINDCLLYTSPSPRDS